jgi:hypothetical protein
LAVSRGRISGVWGGTAGVPAPLGHSRQAKAAVAQSGSASHLLTIRRNGQGLFSTCRTKTRLSCNPSPSVT